MAIRHACTWIAAWTLLASTGACSAEPSPTPASDAGQWKGLATLSQTLAGDGVARDYMRRAKAADQIADPLARCLAFPDFPGNRWPDGLAAAHCELEFGARVRAEDVQRAIDGNALPALDARFAADLARHFSETGFSEAIHGDFDAFDGSARSDALSKAWLAKAPDSPFALAARGEHFRRAGNTLRGGRFPDDISEAEFDQLAKLADEALAHFERALAREPRLIHAYVGMVNVARVDSRATVQQDAIRRGSALDPACVELADQVMVSLAPQWSGRKDLMGAYGEELAKHLDRRPLLALRIAWPMVYAAASLREADQHALAARLAGEAAWISPIPEAFEELVYTRRSDPAAQPLEAAAYAVAASRWAPDLAAAARGKLLLERADDPQWALPALESAVRRSPGDGVARYYLGETYRALQRTDDARREYTLAMADEGGRDAAMHKLALLETAAAPKQLDATKAIGPAEAIRLALATDPAGVPGTFAFEVVATGAIGDSVYLNSYPDYRNPQNVTIEIYRGAAAALREQLGPDLEAALKGRTVIVTGVVRRVPIFVGGPPKPETPAYFQTHVKVHDAAQLRVAP